MVACSLSHNFMEHRRVGRRTAILPYTIMNDTEYVHGNSGVAPAEDRHHEQDPSSVPMCVVEHGKTIAFAAYNAATNQIILEECAATAMGYDVYEMVERVVATVRPTLLLLSSKVCGNDNLFQSVRKAPPSVSPFLPQETISDNEDERNATNEPNLAPEFGSTLPYKLMKSSYFDYRKCKANILNLQVGSLVQQAATARSGHLNQPRRHFHNENGHVFKISNYHALVTMLDFDSIAQVQAVGCLLSFLENHEDQRENHGIICVNDIVCANTSLFMTISQETLSALHIFSTEHHPLVAAKGSGNAKEGFSLFSLLDRTGSRAGRTKLREWMLKPLMNVEAITKRQDGVELFLLPEARAQTESIAKLMERIGAVDKIILRIKKCNAKFNDFLALTKALTSAVAIFDTLQDEVLQKLRQHDTMEPSSLQEEIESPTSNGSMYLHPRARQYVTFVTEMLERCHVVELQALFERITSIVNEEDSFRSKTVVIRAGFDSHLDEARIQFAGLEGEK